MAMTRDRRTEQLVCLCDTTGSTPHTRAAKRRDGSCCWGLGREEMSCARGPPLGRMSWMIVAVAPVAAVEAAAGSLVDNAGP